MSRFEYQPTLPGLDGPEWDSPQPMLPIEDELSNEELLHTLDTLHTAIDTAEQREDEPAMVDKLLYSQLGELAVRRGLMAEVVIEGMPSAREENIATVRENLNNPRGMTAETRQELEESLASMLTEYHELAVR